MEVFPLSPGGGSPLTDRSKVARFWTAFGKEMEDDQAQQDCAHFSKKFKLDHGCTTISSMKGLSHNAFCSVLSSRERLGWCASIENVLGQQFGRRSASVPASAHMGDAAPELHPLVVSSGKGTGGGMQVERFPPKRKLGDYLERRNELHLIDPPFDTFGSVIDFECDDPSNKLLTSKDTNAISDEVFWYMASKHDYVAGDTIIDTYLGRQLKKRYPCPHKGKNWSDIVRIRKKNGRCANGLVRSSALTPPLLDHPS